jgi:hypothetical protein
MTAESQDIPDNPLIEALRAALADFNEHAPQALFAAAKAIVADHDQQAAYVTQMMTIPRPTAEQVRAQLGLRSGQDTP